MEGTKRKMNIAVLTPTYLPIVGGAEVGIYEIYKRIAQRHKVTVYTPRYTQRASYDGAQDDYFDSGGFEVRRYEDRHLFTNWHPRLVKLLDCVYPDYSLGAVCIAQTIISDNRPDVVNCHYLLQNLGAIRYVVQHIGIPVVLSIIGREFDNVGRWCTTRWVASRALLHQ
jgi:glycosyltransferase involved in cell wall biosynthesis